jgi:hypothetical protein
VPRRGRRRPTRLVHRRPHRRRTRAAARQDEDGNSGDRRAGHRENVAPETIRSEMDEPIYASDPAAAPDEDFEPGRIEHLVAGNPGRLLDERRTPVVVRSVDERTGQFAVEIRAFEDAGAQWEVPFEDVGRFQFARHAELLSPPAAGACRAIAARLDRPLHIPAAAAPDVERERAWAQAALGPIELPDPEAAIAARTGDPGLAAAVGAALAERGLSDMDEAFAARYHSNPASGELVKGHAIVAAEIGLAPYRGKVVRDDRLFDEPWTKARRAEHLLARMALTRELWRRAGAERSVHRATRPDRPDAASFYSVTFAREVAEAHATATLVSAPLPLDSLLMTFWETSALNRHYREAEAVVLRRPGPSPTAGGSPARAGR